MGAQKRARQLRHTLSGVLLLPVSASLGLFGIFMVVFDGYIGIHKTRGEIHAVAEARSLSMIGSMASMSPASTLSAA